MGGERSSGVTMQMDGGAGQLFLPGFCLSHCVTLCSLMRTNWLEWNKWIMDVNKELCSLGACFAGVRPGPGHWARHAG